MSTDKATRQRGSSIKRIETSRGVRWRFRLDLEPDEGGKRRQRTYTFATEAEAIREQARLRTDVATGVHVDRDVTTLGEYLTAWLEAHRHHWRPSTYRGYTTDLQPIREGLGHKRLQALKRTDIEALVGKMLREGGLTGEGRSPRTVGKALGILTKALDDAVRDELLQRNPAQYVRKPRQQQTEMKSWTADQAAAFLRHVDEHRLVGAFHLSLRGLRRGEVLGLRWGDVDLEAGVAHVRQTRVQAGTEVVVGPPKTARGRRSVPLDPEAIRALRLTRERTLGTEVVPLRPGEPIAERYLVTDDLGDPMRPERYGDLFIEETRAASLPVIRLHDARHTAATLMLRAGLPVHVVAGVLGHDPAMTMRTYAHVDDTAKREATAALGALFAR